MFRVENNQQKEPYRFCWTSSYDRNLYENLRFLWPSIKERIPQAEFHIYYGDELLHDTIKTTLAPLYKLPGVYHHGRVSLKKIAIEKKRASFQLYVTDTNAEIDCISVRESAAAGCIPIITSKAVFGERDGFHVYLENIRNQEEMKSVADEIVSFVLDKDKVLNLSNEIKNSDLIFNWDVVSKKWVNEFRK